MDTDTKTTTSPGAMTHATKNIWDYLELPWEFKVGDPAELLDALAADNWPEDSDAAITRKVLEHHGQWQLLERGETLWPELLQEVLDRCQQACGVSERFAVQVKECKHAQFYYLLRPLVALTFNFGQPGMGKTQGARIGLLLHALVSHYDGLTQAIEEVSIGDGDWFAAWSQAWAKCRIDKEAECEAHGVPPRVAAVLQSIGRIGDFRAPLIGLFEALPSRADHLHCALRHLHWRLVRQQGEKAFARFSAQAFNWMRAQLKYLSDDLVPEPALMPVYGERSDDRSSADNLRPYSYLIEGILSGQKISGSIEVQPQPMEKEVEVSTFIIHLNEAPPDAEIVLKCGGREQKRKPIRRIPGAVSLDINNFYGRSHRIDIVCGSAAESLNILDL